MITLKSPREIKEMQKSGQILAGMHIGLRDIIKPGISSWEIEKFARKYFKEHDAIAEQIGLLAMAKGWDVYMAHGVRHSNPSQLMTIPMVTPLEEKVHALYSLLDRHGLGPNGKTKKLME